MSGKDIALDFIQFGPKNYFSAPGGILFIKKDVILNTGGFDRSSDATQIIKFAIHGDSGFDPKAKIFWRHHKGQLNKVAKTKGMVWCRDLEYVIKNEKILSNNNRKSYEAYAGRKQNGFHSRKKIEKRRDKETS